MRGGDNIWVWDSAVYSGANVKEISECNKWITRVPETLSEAKELLENSDVDQMSSTSLNGYRLFSTVVVYGSVKQRWIVVFSEKAFTRETKTLEKKIKKEKEKVEKELWHFGNHEFYSVEDGLKALRNMEKAWKYHHLKGSEVEERKKKKSGCRGRPKGEVDLQRLFTIKADFEEDKGAIRKEMLRKGKFIVATNELNREKLSDEEALKACKEQQHAERGFRFLKDPFFFADSIFLKNEDRIVAMVMIMGVALMVYSLAEKKLRKALEKEHETIPDQRNKPTKRPTMRRTFQVFEGISVLYLGSKMVKVMNVRPIHEKILALLGHEYERMYCIGYE